MKQPPAFWIRLTKVTVPCLLILAVSRLGFVLVSTARAVLRQSQRLHTSHQFTVHQAQIKDRYKGWAIKRRERGTTTATWSSHTQT